MRIRECNKTFLDCELVPLNYIAKANECLTRYKLSGKNNKQIVLMPYFREGMNVFSSQNYAIAYPRQTEG